MSDDECGLARTQAPTARQRAARRSTHARFAVGGAAMLAATVIAVGFTMPQELPPTSRVATCTTSGCHSEVTQFQFLHAPVAVDACEICHVYDDPAQHTFRLIEQHGDEPICSFCHIGKSTFGGGDNWTGMHVHEPVADGNCTGCHNPHGSNLRNLVAAETVGSLCSSCHEHVVNQPHMHPSVGEKECLSCHMPHSGPHENLLHQTGRELCLSCHADVLPRNGGDAQSHLRPPSARPTLHAGAQSVMWTATLMARGTAHNAHNAGAAATRPTIIHEPLMGECAECHNPHGSPYPRMLQKEATTLCISCHEDVGRDIAAATIHHSAVRDDRACMNCHSPHHSEHTSLLNDQPIALCASCHQDAHQRPDGTMIEGMGTLFAGSQLHGPVSDGTCSGCHDVHGGQHRSLLQGSYSDDLYQSFSEDNFSLCFTCHDPALAREQRTTTATNFRQGDVNLHYVHVVGPDESGRSCRFCHDTHASKSQRLMRESVPYGQWSLPIRYEASDTGGTCGAGCHREQTYSRSLDR